jgi:hypothetical protein
MYETPEHLPIKVNAQGQGPIEDHEPGHWTCWCGRNTCMWAAAFEADRAEALAPLRALIKPQWRVNRGYEYSSTSDAFAAGRNEVIDALRALFKDTQA